MAQLVLTAVGLDRPGLVRELTQGFQRHGVSVGDSRMVNLRGLFAWIALIEGDAGALALVREELPRAASSLGLSLSLHDHAVAPARPASVPYRLRTYSMDRPGIVHALSSTLARHGVNIESLDTRAESAPFDGTPLFTLEARLSVPATLSLARLREDVRAAADSLNCDFDLDRA
ncbi:MAG: ACT domain-containing protein [Polyangiaceae bacterium]|nr:ACT domain-containing protein [Polyangiaceae bacterium]